MKFACIIYQDGSTLAGLTEAEQLAAIAAECKAAEVWKADLEKSGRCVFCAGLQSPATAVTVRKRDGGVSMTDGPFAETKEVLGGFIIIEARDLNEALQLTSRF